MKRQSKNRNVRNNNPLNIKESAEWEGETLLNFDPLFEEFKSPEYGFRAGYIILLQYLERGDNTISQIIHKWAPANTDEKNHTQHYINYVSAKMGLSPTDYVEPYQLPRLMLYMAKFEGDNIDYFTIEQAVDAVALAQEESFVIARLGRLGVEVARPLVEVA